MSEGGAEVLPGSESGENQNWFTSTKSCSEGPGPRRSMNPEGLTQPADMMGLQLGEVPGRGPGSFLVGWGQEAPVLSFTLVGEHSWGQQCGHREAQSW